MSAELPLGQEQAAPLTCSLRSRPFFFGLRRFASRACRSIRCATARLCFAERLTVGRFELTHFARMGGVTVFSRYAERAGEHAQRYAPLQVHSVEFGHRSVHRFGKPLHSAGLSSNRHLEPRRGQPVGALAASFLESGGGNAKPNRRQCAPSCSP